jgi:divalent metal cation (Fe/Co/Zn/Cd) transporter
MTPVSDRAVAGQKIAVSPNTVRSIIRIQVFTIIWMSVEGAVSLVAAGRARSPALLGFGGDSVIELLSAVVVFLRFQSESNQEKTERWAAKVAGTLLFALGACVVLTSTLSLLGSHEARPSFIGIGLLLGAAFVMPWLARKKRELAAIASSAALRADAAESSLCGYVAWITLAGLALNVVWKKSWADPVAALALVPIIVREGWEAIRQSRVGYNC